MDNFITRFKSIFTKKETSLKTDSFVLTISKVVTAVIGFLVTMLLSRYRTLEEYGTYSQLVLVVTLLNSIVMLGLPHAISYFIGRSSEKEEKQKFFSTYFILNTILSLISATILLSLLTLIVKYFNNSELYGFWFFLLIYPWTYVTTSSIENICVSMERTSLILPFRVAHSLLTLIAVVMSTILKIDFRSYVFIYICIEIVFATSIYILTFKICGRFTLKFSKDIALAIFKFSIPIGIASAVGTLNTELDKFMIGYLADTEIVAIYTNCAKELPFNIFSAAITASLLPRISKYIKEHKNNDAITMWGDAVFISISIISLFSFGLFAFSKDVISIIYSEKYLAGESIFKVFCVVLLFRSVYWGLILNCSGNTKMILFSSIGSLLLNVALNYPLFLLWGSFGCAISSLISIAAMCIFQLFWTCKITKIGLRKIWPWKKIFSVLAINLILFGIFYIMKIYIPFEKLVGSEIESVIYGGLWAITYFFIWKNLYGKYYFRKKN